MRTFLPCSRSISTKYWSCQPRIKFSTVNQTREMFPWRERSQWKSTFQSMCRYGITRFYFYVLDYNVEDFLKTTEAVFRLATDSVFQLSKQNENSKKDEVLYEDLRNHFSATIDNYVAKHPNHIVHYHLNNIMRSRFLTGEIVWYSADYFRMDHLLQKVDGGTVNLYFVPELIPREAYELLGKDGPPLDRSLMRIWIEYDCEEIFYIHDNESNTLIEGSKDPVQRKHTMLLEMPVRINFDDSDIEFITDWKIMDIDDWLEGCHDHWTKKRLINRRG